METPLVLTFDIGTQSIRCLLARPDGSFSDMVQRKYDQPYFSLEPGWAEQRPDFYYEQMCLAAKTLCQRNRELLPDIVAVTLTAIRDTVVCLDEKQEPLRDIILWLDKRQAAWDRPFPLYKSWMFRLVGMTEATKTIYRASVCNWIRQNEPEIWEKTDKYVFLPGYLNYKITGQQVDAEANMIGHIPYDCKHRRWKSRHDLTRCIHDVPVSKMPPLKKSGEVLGYVTGEFSRASGVPEGLPLIATGSDKGCETLGLSVVQPHKAALSFGTTATIQLAVEKYFEPQSFMPAYPAVPNHLYNPEIELYRGFWLVSWFIREFGQKEQAQAQALGCSPEEVLDRAIREIPPGCEGLLLQPYWTPGILHPNSRGAVVGFADYHTHLHLYRAIIEGIVFEMYHSLRNMERRSGLRIRQLYVAGGGAQSDTACQITADVFGLPVKRIQTHEASGLGASMVAFLWAGVFQNYDEAISHMVHEGDTFLPNQDVHSIYMEIYKGAYRKIFTRLEPVYKRILKTIKRRDVL